MEHPTILSFCILSFSKLLSSDGLGCISAEDQDPSRNKCPRYEIKLSDGKVPLLEILGMWCTPSLALLPGPIWPGVVAPHRLLGQIEQNMRANKWLMLIRDCYIAILETI